MDYPKNYKDKVYSGWLGKIIGIIYGTPTEGWKNEEIEEVFDKYDNYLTDYKRYASDDDYIWGMIYQENLKKLSRKNLDGANFANAIMNLVPNGHGVMWWGGKNIATEHTAFININEGIIPPLTGSKKTNTDYITEQIGGEIFNDHWGLLSPIDKLEAMKLAKKMAKVTHDGDAVVGAMFMSACVSLAFDNYQSIKEIVLKVVDKLPPSHYKEVCCDIIDFQSKNPKWRDNLKYIKENYFSSKKYPGVCHVIPNAAIVLIALLCCENDFTKALEYTLLPGEDTDSNLGNTGMIMGVFVGLDGIDEKWINPLNDEIICSTALGELNIQYISDLAMRTVELSKRYFENAEVSVKEKRVWNFDQKFAKKGFKTWVSSDKNFTKKLNFCKVFEKEKFLRSYFSFLTPGDKFKTYINGFYSVKDFEDSRYDPEISPKIFFGQTINCKVRQEDFEFGQDILGSVFVETLEGKTFESEKIIVKDNWTELKFEIPKVDDDHVYKVGIIYYLDDSKESLKKRFIKMDISEFEITGAPYINLDLKKSKEEYWTRFHKNILGFTTYRHGWEIEKEGIVNKNKEIFNETYFGQNFRNDFTYQINFLAKENANFGLSIFVEGIFEKISFNFKDDKVFITENYDYQNKKIISEGACQIKIGKNKCSIEVRQNKINLFVNEVQIVSNQVFDDTIFKGVGQFSMFENTNDKVVFEKVMVK
ncbi:ADP-ribosylglycohydrolase family protein [Spiroplasma chinense]|uniref:ADP-ribosylglycohydrolase family protein n=1 Tax=Spiroplasma chinense TaxID=216932 RepID=A0A5B9Y5P0_9MOLU|nr:ADP-ribosylglycohydrolase family protein [Spiroplasma chinense]QEH62270.1 ADP-ribosylglycohydrolase family protein [Spiroplasma chinense]